MPGIVSSAPILTVLTPTKNSWPYIVSLIAALEAQTSLDFKWLVIDGGSTDETLCLVQNAKLPHKCTVNSIDFSIYHALNIGLAHLSTTFYLVIGSDDIPSPDCIANYLEELRRDPSADLIFQGVCIKGSSVGVGTSLGWLYGMHGLGSSHSLGTLIRASLHQKYGIYSRDFPRLADQYFVKKAVYGGSNLAKLPVSAGIYSTDGYSSASKQAYLLEFYLMQLRTEKFVGLQHLLFWLRWLKHFAFNTPSLD